MKEKQWETVKTPNIVDKLTKILAQTKYLIELEQRKLIKKAKKTQDMVFDKCK